MTEDYQGPATGLQIQYTLSNPKQYTWKPQADITAYELALCMPMLMSCMTMQGALQADALFRQLTTEAQRHWQVEG